MLAKTITLATRGIDAFLVEVEADVSRGLPAFSTVGLPDTAVKESRDRVRAGILNSGMNFPNQRITINLAPANVKKEGPSFDLPIAIGILAATKQIKPDPLKHLALLGEVSLEGTLRHVEGVLPMAVAARKAGLEGMIVPRTNAKEAAIVKDLPIYPVDSVQEVMAFLNGELSIAPYSVDLETEFHRHRDYAVDFQEVKGQTFAKRALEVAAAGGHNLLLIGPPGAGKTMLAKRLPTILPEMTLEEAIETTKVHSVTGYIPSGQALIATRPFRAPHHTVSDAGLIGGGHMPKPGEVSLANHGILFLDELPEFRRNVLEVLRQPLEDGYVTISRAAAALTYPAAFMLAAAMNPCPCGYFGDPKAQCTCTPPQIARYMGKISGPLLDRIDLHVDVPAVKYAELAEEKGGEASRAIRERVNHARQRQLERFGQVPGTYCNAQMTARHIKRFCAVDAAGQELLRNAIENLGLSARAYDRVKKVARTIADLADSEAIRPENLSEAIQYRSLDRSSRWTGI